jgi:CHASE3 domain sensor protein
MEPITTVLTGIALVKSSVEFIKSNIETVKDIGEIAGSIESLLNGEQEIQKNRFTEKSILGQTKDAASSVIDAKLAQEAMQEMKFLVDFRFGTGTWQSIISERSRRLAQEREQMEQERKERIRKKANFQKNLQYILLFSGAGLLLVVGGMAVLVHLTGGL